ncbi:hypothetical protein D3C71_1371240 [compost metagenome]
MKIVAGVASRRYAAIAFCDGILGAIVPLISFIPGIIKVVSRGFYVNSSAPSASAFHGALKTIYFVLAESKWQ